MEFGEYLSTSDICGYNRSNTDNERMPHKSDKIRRIGLRGFIQRKAANIWLEDLVLKGYKVRGEIHKLTPIL